MNKAILSAFGAFISFLCAVVTLAAFAKFCEPLLAIIAVICICSTIAFIGYGIEDTKLSDKLSNLFGEEASHE